MKLISVILALIVFMIAVPSFADDLSEQQYIVFGDSRNKGASLFVIVDDQANPATVIPMFGRDPDLYNPRDIDPGIPPLETPIKSKFEYEPKLRFDY
jgi:hypothetical protein